MFCRCICKKKLAAAWDIHPQKKKKESRIQISHNEKQKDWDNRDDKLRRMNWKHKKWIVPDSIIL